MTCCFLTELHEVRDIAKACNQFAMSAGDRANNHTRQERARMSHIAWKNDTYKKARGGYARLLAVSCATCGTHLFYYQKDGPGIVKRLYLDRIYGTFQKWPKVVNSLVRETWRRAQFQQG